MKVCVSMKVEKKEQIEIEDIARKKQIYISDVLRTVFNKGLALVKDSDFDHLKGMMLTEEARRVLHRETGILMGEAFFLSRVEETFQKMDQKEVSLKWKKQLLKIYRKEAKLYTKGTLTELNKMVKEKGLLDARITTSKEPAIAAQMREFQRESPEERAAKEKALDEEAKKARDIIHREANNS